MQARTLELFELRGLSKRLVDCGNQGIAVSAYGGGKRIFRLEFKTVDSKYKYILFVSQAETEKVLRDALATKSVHIEWETTLIGFSKAENSDSVTAILRHSDGTLESLDCAYLISSEGAHSIVRETLGLPFEGKSLEEQYALGDFYIDGDLPDSDLHVFSSEHGFLGMFPMGNKRFRLIASNPISKPSKNTVPSIEELQNLYDQRSAIPVKFRDLSWSSWFHINSRMIRHLRSGRIFLGGDSAHIHSPAGAQGMNTGIQDMINLSWKVAMVLKGHAKDELLDTYTSDRIPVIEGVLTQTEQLTHAIGAENPLFRSVFNHLAPWFVGTDFVQHNSTERMSQLGLNYRKSPLSEEHGSGGSLKAGDRVPDLAVSLMDTEGSTERRRNAATLFQLLNPSAFTLLYRNLSEPARIERIIAPWRYLINSYEIAPIENNALTNLFGKSSSIVLVRPDGYVGFTGNEESVAELTKYCEKWLLAGPSSNRQ